LPGSFLVSFCTTHFTDNTPVLTPSLMALTVPVVSHAAGQDSARALVFDPIDSTVDVTLLGDKITPVIQWIFQKQPWVMWTGAIIGVAVALTILGYLWVHRQAIRTWVTTRHARVKAAMVAAGALAVLGAGGLAFEANHFVETDKRFCNGCHIFIGTGQAWIQPDSGNYTVVPKLEGKHDSIGCHTCHPLKPMKEGVKLILWMSGIREDSIPPHARVPREICENCHVKGQAREEWEAIAATAGHRTHFESDSSALKDKVECLTCHALTAHRFPPTDSTCGQSDCHKPAEFRIVLGKMKDVGEFHCVGCHEFTAKVPALATRDSAAGTLTPAIRSCFRCHAMQERLPDFDERKDPHNGTCGMCHRPHTQETKEETLKTCSTRECHGLWNEIPFHAGAQHRKKAKECTLCHAPHAARVDAADCVGCHQRVRDYAPGRRLFPPLPFDTTEAMQQSAAPIVEHPDPLPRVPERPSKVKGDAPTPVAPPQAPERPSKVKGDAPPVEEPGPLVTPLTPEPEDTFSHPIHKKLACLVCHLSTSQEKLTFEAPRGCQICHHEGKPRKECKECHSDEDLAKAIEAKLTVQVEKHDPRTRPVEFQHDLHVEKKECLDCHTTRVSLEPGDSVKSCEGCHADHHEAGRKCASCHRTEAITKPHENFQEIHWGCDACHTPARIEILQPVRSFCLACHDPEQDHNKEKECSACHFFTSPDQLKPRLLSTAGGAG
jgi:hypothetical protein